MDTQAFFDALPATFHGDPASSDPIDTHWESVVENVAGYTAKNELAVLNLAASMLPAGEAYLEVGTFKGRSMVGAVRDNSDTIFYAMENFLEFGMSGQEARAELMENLRTYGAHADVRLLEGDNFRLMAEPNIVDQPIGVYFYDGEHTLLAHYLALAAVEPLLADEALILVDDATWPVVQRAHAKYLAKNPEWKLVAEWDALTEHDERWANGLHALTFHRREPSVLSGRDEWLRKFEVTIQSRLNRIAWKLSERFPRLVTFGAKLVMSRSRAIESKTSQ